MKLIFEWDERKDRRNQKAHRVGFEEAKTVFNDPFLITSPDELHSADEDRLLSVGMSINDRVLLVVHTENHETKGSYAGAHNQRPKGDFIGAQSL